MADRKPTVRNRADGAIRSAKLGNVGIAGAPPLPFVDQETIGGVGTQRAPFHVLGEDGVADVAFSVTMESSVLSFVVTMPIARNNTNYAVFGSCGSVTDIVGFAFPLSGMTTTSFVVQLTGLSTPGDVYWFTVQGLS